MKFSVFCKHTSLHLQTIKEQINYLRIGRFEVFSFQPYSSKLCFEMMKYRETYDVNQIPSGLIDGRIGNQVSYHIYTLRASLNDGDVLNESFRRKV